jgi:hypothetical protein
VSGFGTGSVLDEACEGDERLRGVTKSIVMTTSNAFGRDQAMRWREWVIEYE